MAKYESRKKLAHKLEFYGNRSKKPNDHCIYTTVDGKKGWYETEDHLIRRLVDLKIDRVYSTNVANDRRATHYGGGISTVSCDIKKILKKYALSHGFDYKPDIIVLMSDNYYSSCCVSAYTLPSRFNEDYEFMHWRHVLGCPIIRCTSHLDKIDDFKIIVKDNQQEPLGNNRKIIETVRKYFMEGGFDPAQFSAMIDDIENAYKTQNMTHDGEKESLR